MSYDYLDQLLKSSVRDDFLLEESSRSNLANIQKCKQCLWFFTHFIAAEDTIYSFYLSLRFNS